MRHIRVLTYFSTLGALGSCLGMIISNDWGMIIFLMGAATAEVRKVRKMAGSAGAAKSRWHPVPFTNFEATLRWLPADGTLRAIDICFNMGVSSSSWGYPKMDGLFHGTSH